MKKVEFATAEIEEAWTKIPAPSKENDEFEKIHNIHSPHYTGIPPKSQQDGMTAAHNVPKDISQKSGLVKPSDLTPSEFIQWMANEFYEQHSPENEFLTLELSREIIAAEYRKAMNHLSCNKKL